MILDNALLTTDNHENKPGCFKHLITNEIHGNLFKFIQNDVVAERRMQCIVETQSPIEINWADGFGHAIVIIETVIENYWQLSGFTWASGDAEGDAGREDADSGVGCVLTQQFDENDAAFQQGSQSRIAQPLEISPFRFPGQGERKSRRIFR